MHTIHSGRSILLDTFTNIPMSQVICMPVYLRCLFTPGSFFFIPRANINIKTNNINTLHVESILFFIFSCHTNNCFTRVHQRVTEVSEADGSKHEKK